MLNGNENSLLPYLRQKVGGIVTKPIYTYTSIHIKEAFQFEQLLENIFKGMNVSYKRKSEYMEFETDKFTLICAPLF